MITTITQNTFIDGFPKSYNKNFSYNGKIALFKYLEALEEDCDTTIKFDPIALCCEYAEYADLEDFKKDYDHEDHETIEDIEDVTTVIMIDDERFIIAQF